MHIHNLFPTSLICILRIVLLGCASVFSLVLSATPQLNIKDDSQCLTSNNIEAELSKRNEAQHTLALKRVYIHVTRTTVSSKYALDIQLHFKDKTEKERSYFTTAECHDASQLAILTFESMLDRQAHHPQVRQPKYKTNVDYHINIGVGLNINTDRDVGLHGLIKLGLSLGRAKQHTEVRDQVSKLLLELVYLPTMPVRASFGLDDRQQGQIRQYSLGLNLGVMIEKRTMKFPFYLLAAFNRSLHTGFEEDGHSQGLILGGGFATHLRLTQKIWLAFDNRFHIRHPRYTVDNTDISIHHPLWLPSLSCNLVF